MSIMSDEAEVYPTKTVATCDVCGKCDPVQWFCENCPGSLCNSCKVIHKSTVISSKHSVIPWIQTVTVKTPRPSTIPQQCINHVGKDIIIYCKKCKVACCVSCFAEKHKLHDMCPIQGAYIEKEQYLKSYANKLEDNVQKDLDTLINEVKCDNVEYEFRTNKAIEDVNVFRKEMKNEVDIQCDSLIDALQTQNLEREDLILRLLKQKQSVDQLIRACKKKTIVEGTLDMIDYTPPDPSSLIQYKQVKPSVKPVFAPDTMLLDKLRKRIDRIQVGEVDEKRLKYISKTTKSDQEFDLNKLKIEKISSFRCETGVIAVACAKHDLAWIAHNDNDKMYLYNSQNGDIIGDND